MFVDTHAHVDYDKFDEDRAEVIKRAKEAKLTHIIQIALGPQEESIQKAYDMVQSDDMFTMAVGLHPHDADAHTDEIEAIIEQYLTKPKVVALGEIGLDYYYDNSDRDNQRHAFESLMSVAKRMQKPICVHTRDAFDDTLALTQNQDIFTTAQGVIHCFTGDKRQARAFLDAGALISFSGVVTFSKAIDVQEAATFVPLDRMLIETDCPFLAPTPHRGKRNEPSYVVEVAKKIAALKNISVEEVATQTTQNAQTLFGL